MYCLVGFFFLCFLYAEGISISVWVSNSDAFSIAPFRQNVCYYGFPKLLNFPGLCKNLPLQPKPVFQHFPCGVQCLISPDGSKESLQHPQESPGQFMAQTKSSRTICVQPTLTQQSSRQLLKLRVITVCFEHNGFQRQHNLGRMPMALWCSLKLGMWSGMQNSYEFKPHYSGNKSKSCACVFRGEWVLL